MSRLSANAIGVDATEERIPNGRSERQRSFRWLNFRPQVVTVFGLALTIFLWGYNYKLSLYQAHRDTASRTLAPKLWIDQRHAGGIVVSDLNQDATRHASSQAVAVSPLEAFDLISIGIVAVLPTAIHRAYLSQSLLPLRSPPLHSFLG